VWRIALVIVAACGRLGFDPAGDARAGAPGDAIFGVTPATYIKASNAEASDVFGDAVALSADCTMLAVAANGEDSTATGIDGDQRSNFASGAGAVYIFVRNGGWQQQAYLKASNTDPEDGFGISIALSADGTTLAVGAPGEDSRPGDPTDNSRTNAGAVYVFVRAGASWTQQAFLKASNADNEDLFGRLALSADGNTLVVSAFEEDSAVTGIDGSQNSNTASSAGAVYVFARSGQAWSQQAYIKASNTDAFDEFGSSLALSADGTTLAVGALGEDSAATGIGGNGGDNSAEISGAAYVYTRTGTTWSFQAYVKASNTGLHDRFGTDVALSADGNLLAVGAPFESSNATGVDGDQQNELASLSGAAYLFSRVNARWTQTAYVKASNTGSHDFFGQRVALSPDGTRLAVSAISEASGNPADQNDDSTIEAGAVYVFSFAQRWGQIAYLKAPHPDALDYLGTSLSVCATAVAAGATGDSSAATGIGGDTTDNTAANAGATYVFDL
jgi:hypothetical protein